MIYFTSLFYINSGLYHTWIVQFFIHNIAYLDYEYYFISFCESLISVVLIARSLLVSVIVWGIKKVDNKKIGYSEKFLEPMNCLWTEVNRVQMVWI